ncbi:cytochrome c, partial [Oleiphilus sp. HI0123]
KVIVKKAELKVSEERALELDYLVKQDCGSCHGMLFKGGLGPALLPENIKAYSVEDLMAVILHGRPGTPMPPWKAILSEADANWIAKALKSGEMIDAN